MEGRVPFNPLQHPILYQEPRRIAPSGWIGHIPFGMFLVEILEPRVLVELGTYTGVSYCAFCQAVRELEYPTRCYAVDTWKGDPQAGYYGPEVLRDLREHHDPLYGDFSRLLQTTFDDALGEFGEGTIDLLHIDGYHSYRAVRKDWDHWLPKMSERGVVLLHDTSVREEGFEVWKLWEELVREYPHFELPHEHGLGLLAVGEEVPPGVEDLVTCSGPVRERIQGFFERLGNRIHADLGVQELREEIEEKEERVQAVLDLAAEQEGEIEELSSGLEEGAHIQDLYRRLREREKEFQDLESELAEIKDSRAWRLIQFLWRLRLKVIPPGSARERIAKGLLSTIWSKGGEARERRPSTSRGRKRHEGGGGWEGVRGVGPSREGGKEAALAWWEDYLALKEEIQKVAEGSGGGPLSAPAMISYDPEDLAAVAGQMAFPRWEHPLVSIVIPVWNQLQLTLECLGSIQRHTNGVPYELVLVDDGSRDGTPEVIPEIDPVKYIRNEEHLGFVHSCNRGADAAQGEYVLFLNNDVQVQEGWLRALVAPFRDQDCVGAVGPKILFPDGRLQEAGAVVQADGTTRLVGLYDDPDLPRYNYQRRVDYVSGVCLLLKEEDFSDLGGFSEEFAPAYGEDVDLCLRLRERGKQVLYVPSSTIIHHLSATINSLGEGEKQRLAVKNAQKLMEKWGDEIESHGKTRLISFYLPQFHPIPENDLWWGKGFTDWRNVVDTQPVFEGHYQPRLPADLGFYDLKVEEVLQEQAALARRYGIHGFCFYTYWFGGKRLLDQPLQHLLERDRSPIPFCLCWANENWTRTWDGHQDQVLISQEHAKLRDRDFIADIVPYLRHPDYIRVDGKPLLLIYRVDLLDGARETVKDWRQYCREHEIGELYLVMVQSFDQGLGASLEPPSAYGCDAAVEFPPHPFDHEFISPPGRLLDPRFEGSIHDYRQTALAYLRDQAPDFTRFRGVMPGWDNTPRRQNGGTAYVHSSPGAYQAWLEAAVEFTRGQFVGDERLVFINAWNEWAEGAYLEPDQRFGHGYLEATRNALERELLKERQR